MVAHAENVITTPATAVDLELSAMERQLFSVVAESLISYLHSPSGYQDAKGKLAVEEALTSLADARGAQKNISFTQLTAGIRNDAEFDIIIKTLNKSAEEFKGQGEEKNPYKLIAEALLQTKASLSEPISWQSLRPPTLDATLDFRRTLDCNGTPEFREAFARLYDASFSGLHHTQEMEVRGLKLVGPSMDCYSQYYSSADTFREQTSYLPPLTEGFRGNSPRIHVEVRCTSEDGIEQYGITDLDMRRTQSFGAILIPNPNPGTWGTRDDLRDRKITGWYGAPQDRPEIFNSSGTFEQILQNDPRTDLAGRVPPLMSAISPETPVVDLVALVPVSSKGDFKTEVTLSTLNSRFENEWPRRMFVICSGDRLVYRRPMSGKELSLVDANSGVNGQNLDKRWDVGGKQGLVDNEIGSAYPCAADEILVLSIPREPLANEQPSPLYALSDESTRHTMGIKDTVLSTGSTIAKSGISTTAVESRQDEPATLYRIKIVGYDGSSPIKSSDLVKLAESSFP